MSSKTAPKAQPFTRAGGPSIGDMRLAIAAALEGGTPISDLRLRVTRRDEAQIKRSPDVSLDEVSFAGGEMRFLGVKVITGSIAVSMLDLNGAETEAAEIAAAEALAAIPVKVKKTRAKAAPKVKAKAAA
jgi:hypothetical protein